MTSTGNSGWIRRARHRRQRMVRWARRTSLRLRASVTDVVRRASTMDDLGRRGQREIRRLRRELRAHARLITTEAQGRSYRSMSLLLLMLTAASLPMQNLRVTSGVAVADVFLIAAAASAVASRHPRPSAAPLPSTLGIGLVLMAVGGVLGLLFADERATSTTLFVRLVVVVVVVFAAVLRVAPSGREVQRLLTVFVVSAAFSAVLSSLGDVTGWPLLNASTFGGRAVGFTLTRFPLVDEVRGVDGGSSLATNPNLFGAVTAVAGAAALALLVEAVTRRRQVLMGISFVGLALGVLFSGSRSSLLALLVGSTFAIWRLVARGYRRQVLAGAAAVAVVGVLAFSAGASAPSLDRLLLRTDTATSERTAESTILRYQNATRGLENRGWRSLATGSGLRDDTASKLHDGHLEIWVGLGLIGLLGWSLVCFSVVERGARHAGRAGPLRPHEEALLAIGGAFTANMVVTLFVDTVWNRYIWLLVALSVTLVLRPNGIEQPHPAASTGRATDEPNPALVSA